MKILWNRLCSMRTANILLALVALLCGLSSLIPQGRELPFYAENYPRAYTLIAAGGAAVPEPAAVLGADVWESAEKQPGGRAEGCGASQC